MSLALYACGEFPRRSEIITLSVLVDDNDVHEKEGLALLKSAIPPQGHDGVMVIVQESILRLSPVALSPAGRKSDGWADARQGELVYANHKGETVVACVLCCDDTRQRRDSRGQLSLSSVTGIGIHPFAKLRLALDHGFNAENSQL